MMILVGLTGFGVLWIIVEAVRTGLSLGRQPIGKPFDWSFVLVAAAAIFLGLCFFYKLSSLGSLSTPKSLVMLLAVGSGIYGLHLVNSLSRPGWKWWFGALVILFLIPRGTSISQSRQMYRYSRYSS